MGNSFWSKEVGESHPSSPTDSGDSNPIAAVDGSPADHAHHPLEFVILGTGAGATYTYSQQPSSSFVVLKGGSPVLLCDVGYGVTASCTQRVGCLPAHIYVSHNHGDHNGELPVVLAVESRAAEAEGRGPPSLYSHPDVMPELRNHRLRELRSTGRPQEDFAVFREVPSGGTTPIGDTGLAVRPFRSRHSETCYGLVLYDEGRPVLGWTADSGYDEALYGQLSEAPLLLVDARCKGTIEHAGFDDLGRLAALPFIRGKPIYVTGYGRQDEAPKPEFEVPGVQIARPGMRIQATAAAGLLAL